MIIWKTRRTGSTSRFPLPLAKQIKLETFARIGECTGTTKNGVVQIEEEVGRHIGTVNQGRWRLLVTKYEQRDLIRALPASILQVQEEERSLGVPSHKLWRWIRLIRAAFNADVASGATLSGWCPQPASKLPSAFE